MMQFRIADTFQASLTKLTNQEQKAVKITVFDLQADPSSPGLKFHKLDKAKDPNFWSVRVNRDIRLIVHRTPSSILIAYVDHHDDAYAWAERRRIEVHPRTGAAQLVEVRETVREIVSQRPAPIEPALPDEPPLFETPSDDDLLSYGVPQDWLSDVRRVSESGLFDLLEHLPQEAAEALLELATGGTPEMPATEAVADPFQHPDALRRFRVMDNVEELELALDYPWEKWTVFLHPAQRDYVERNYSGPTRVGGTAGTGKTVVALHRAVWLAKKHPESRVLLTTFNETLADNLQLKLDRLEPSAKIRDRIDVKTLARVVSELHGDLFGSGSAVTVRELDEVVREAGAKVAHSFSDEFVAAEWSDVVDSWGVTDWDKYRTVPRLGRKTRLGARQREVLWSIFEEVTRSLRKRGYATERMMQERVSAKLADAGAPYSFIVVDEAQDISVAQLRFLCSLAPDNGNGMFFAGDLGQRIFQSPFSWKSLGVDVRGRSFTLKINYRTSHQIRRKADRLLPNAVQDVDGILEDRRGVVSVFDGPEPEIVNFEDAEGEAKHVAAWIRGILAAGGSPGEVGIFVRSTREIERAESVLRRLGAVGPNAAKSPVPTADKITISTMHGAKGLEFRSVAVMACDDEVIPDQDRIESVVDEADLQEVYDTERHLLYVACTRARDHLLVTGVNPVSEFLDDLVER